MFRVQRLFVADGRGKQWVQHCPLSQHRTSKRPDVSFAVLYPSTSRNISARDGHTHDGKGAWQVRGCHPGTCHASGLWEQLDSSGHNQQGKGWRSEWGRKRLAPPLRSCVHLLREDRSMRLQHPWCGRTTPHTGAAGWYSQPGPTPWGSCSQEGLPRHPCMQPCSQGCEEWCRRIGGVSGGGAGQGSGTRAQHSNRTSTHKLVTGLARRG